MCKSISRELNIVNEWFCVNKLSLNLEKTHFVLSTNCKSVKNQKIVKDVQCYELFGGIALKNHAFSFHFFFNKDKVIARVKATKFLGIHINENLSWMDHISYISNKLSKSIAILYCVSSIINIDALKNLYCTLILPYLSYCAMVWENTIYY